MPNPIPTVHSVSNPHAHGYDGRLNDLYFRLFNTPRFTRSSQTAPLEAPRISTEAQAEQFTSDFGRVFSRRDFNGGEGLDFAHRAVQDERDFTRFWDSGGIDASTPEPGAPGHVRLLPKTSQLDSTPTTPLTLLSTDLYLYYIKDGSLYSIQDSNGSFSLDPINLPPDQTLLSATILSNTLYASFGDAGIEKYDPDDDSWSNFSSTDYYDTIWGVKGRIVGQTDNYLYEVFSGSEDDQLLITLQPGHYFTDVVDAGAVIAASSTDGHIYTLTLDEEEAKLSILSRVNVEGEVPVHLAYSQNLIFFSTYESTHSGRIGRLWSAEISPQGFLGNADMIRQWGGKGEESDRTPYSLLALRDRVFVGVADDECSHLWRYSFRTAGRFRHLEPDPECDGPITSIATFNSRLFFTVDETGLFYESDEYVERGYLITPVIDFFSSDEKIWVDFIMSTSTLESGQNISVYYSTDRESINDPDDPNWVGLTSIAQGSLEESIQFQSVTSPSIALKFELAPSLGSDTTPRLFSYAVRSYIADRDIILRLPINTSDHLELPGRRRMTIPGLGESILSYIRDQESKPVLVETFNPYERIEGVIESVETEMISSPLRGTPMFATVVQVRGKRPMQTSSPFLASYSFGSVLFGTGFGGAGNGN